MAGSTWPRPWDTFAPVSRVRPCPCGGASKLCGYCHGTGTYVVTAPERVTVTFGAQHG